MDYSKLLKRTYSIWPTHILAESFSCFDLIFTSHQNLVMESWVHKSLHSNCHHQITYTKFNFKVHYLAPYEREIGHYDKPNVDHIRKTFNRSFGEKELRNLNIYDINHLFCKTFKSIISIYMPDQTVTFMTEILRRLTKMRNS